MQQAKVGFQIGLIAHAELSVGLSILSSVVLTS